MKEKWATWNKNKRYWVVRKSIAYIIALIMFIVGAVMFAKHWFDMSPMWAIIGIVLSLGGLAIFADYYYESYFNFRKKRD